MMYAVSKGVYYVQVRPPRRTEAPVRGPSAAPSSHVVSSLPPQLEDDIVAKPNYFATMKNFALQLSSEDWMILEFSQLGFIGRIH